MTSAIPNVFVEAIGIAAPGLPNWPAAVPVFAGTTPYVPSSLPPHAPALLPPNERRRATPTVRLAFQAAEDVIGRSSIAPAELATVFASSDADLAVIHRISSALAQSPRMISPTDFHNSVHNAAAGYWSIAVGARGPSNAISAFDGSFAAGFAETCAMVAVDGRASLLVAYDLPPPEPLLAKRPITHAAAVAIIVTTERTPTSLAAIEWARTSEQATPASSAELEALRLSNPAMRAVPLLEAFAKRQSCRVIAAGDVDGNLAIDVQRL